MPARARARVAWAGGGGGRGGGPRSTTLAPSPELDPRVGGSGNADDTGLAGPHLPARRRPRPSGAGVVGAVIVVVAVAATAGAAWAQAGDAGAGKAVYERKCASCHGEKGDGQGPAADLLQPAPRDFTRGAYKIRSTADKTPTDRDLFDVVTHGMPGTSMPPWAVLPEKERWNLVAYLKDFAPETFKAAPKTLELPKEVASSPESIKRGREMFEAIECNKCHGNQGRADGPSRAELKDDWGHPIRPADLTKPWSFRGGMSRTAIATRIAAGVLGTPMPSFMDSVEKPEDVWHLTNYVLSLSPGAPRYATLVTVASLAGPIPDDPAADLWTKLAPDNIPLMGQVIQDPRNFNPSVDMVAVRAVYNDKEIAFHLTWNDPTPSAGDGARTFPDAVSLQFPPKPSGGPERPYFLMGDASDGVYLLRWENGKGVGEATANGPAKLVPIAGSEAKGIAVFADGQYRLVIKRPLVSKDDTRPTFQPGVFTPVAFQAWDGGAGEAGTRMSLTSWYYLRLEEPESNRRFVLPPVVAILTLAAMLLVVRVAQMRS